jgi:hypothetical protein
VNFIPGTAYEGSTASGVAAPNNLSTGASDGTPSKNWYAGAAAKYQKPQIGGRIQISYALMDWFSPVLQFDFETVSVDKNHAGGNGLYQSETKIRPGIELDFTPSTNSLLYVGWELTSDTLKAASGSNNAITTSNAFTFGVKSTF